MSERPNGNENGLIHPSFVIEILTRLVFLLKHPMMKIYTQQSFANSLA